VPLLMCALLTGRPLALRGAERRDALQTFRRDAARV